MKKSKDFSPPVVLFYSGIPRAFRTTLIGHLYKIAQVYPTVLLSERLDNETDAVLRRKDLFPGLEKIVPVYQYTNQNQNPFIMNRYLHTVAKEAVLEHKPDIVIAPSDVDSLFEMYLMRFSKKINAFNITISGSISISEMRQIGKWFDLYRLHTYWPTVLPYYIRYFLTKVRKYLGHSLYYYLLPLMVSEVPFFGRASYILHKGHTGMRDSDCHVVLSQREYELYHRDGVPKNKLYIIDHPMKDRKNSIFKTAYLSKLMKIDAGIITIMLPPEEIGFRRDYSLIRSEDRMRLRLDIIEIVSKEFSDYHVYIKPHPMMEQFIGFQELKLKMQSLSRNIEVVDPQSQAEDYIEMGDVIIDLPRSASTTLFTALCQCPEKPILSLDFDHEFLGDAYRNVEGIEYIDDKTCFINTLKAIKDKKYSKKQIPNSNQKAPNRLDDILQLISSISS